MFPVREPGPRQFNTVNGSSSVKLPTNVEKLRLLTKAEKARLLTAVENLGLSISAAERLRLLSKAEELGVLFAATNPATPGALLSLSLALLALGPLCVYLLAEDYPWEVALQVAVALFCVWWICSLRSVQFRVEFAEIQLRRACCGILELVKLIKNQFYRKEEFSIC